jgi:ABC-type nickel/cobalt efflux system permease component RcnA
MADDPVLLGLAVAIALGMRHALEPDHLVALTTLLAGGPDTGPRSAVGFGAAWGAGHGLSLLAFGAPVIVVTARLPTDVERGAEVAVGLLIVLLAVRVLVRWRRGGFHFHEHDHGHGGARHVHVHGHSGPGHGHGHVHRTAAGAFGIGLVHGTGGSAGATVLVLASADSGVAAVGMLVLIAGGAAVAMAGFSGALAVCLHARRVRRRLAPVVLTASAASLVFGAYYTTGALAG